MRTISLDATRIASCRSFADANFIDALAADLIKTGYMFDDHYLEMKHLDPKWMVAVYVCFLGLRRALGGKPAPVASIDRE